MANMQEVTETLVANIEKVVVGKRDKILTVLAALFARGHVLLEDVPGVAKTVLARSISASVGCEFHRVQCTPDLLPTDVTGVSIFNQKTREFEFIKGPVFANILLADEINRATPRAQAALLEAMEERQVTVDGETLALPHPFFVIATQNPIEQEGTFPLPEAQLDRFLIRESMGYPGIDQESEMLDRLREGNPLDGLGQVLDAAALLQIQEYVARIAVHPKVKAYLLEIVHATRGNIKLALGASPRASIGLYRASQAMAALGGRDYVIPDDVKALAVPVLSHRLVMKPEYRLRKESAQTVIQEILAETPQPAAISSFRDSKKQDTAKKAWNAWDHAEKSIPHQADKKKATALKSLGE